METPQKTPIPPVTTGYIPTEEPEYYIENPGQLPLVDLINNRQLATFAREHRYEYSYLREIARGLRPVSERYKQRLAEDLGIPLHSFN